MAQQYFQGTIKTLSDLINQEKQQRFARESPQYQQALFNLMQTKEQAARQNAFLQQVAQGNLTPSQIAQGALAIGQFDPYLRERQGEQALAQEALRGEYGLEEARIRQRGAEQKQLDYGKRVLNQARRTFTGVTSEDEQYILENQTLPPDIDYRWQRRQIPLERIGGEVVLRDVAKKEQELANVEPMLNTLEGKFLELDPGEGIGDYILQTFRTELGKRGVTEFAKYGSYSSMSEALGTLLARNLGDRGNIAVTERQINKSLIPKPQDTKELGTAKIANLKSLLEAIKTNNREKMISILRNNGISFTDATTGSTFVPSKNANKVPLKLPRIEEEQPTPQTTPITGYEEEAGWLKEFNQGQQ